MTLPRWVVVLGWIAAAAAVAVLAFVWSFTGPALSSDPAPDNNLLPSLTQALLAALVVIALAVLTVVYRRSAEAAQG